VQGETTWSDIYGSDTVEHLWSGIIATTQQAYVLWLSLVSQVCSNDVWNKRLCYPL